MNVQTSVRVDRNELMRVARDISNKEVDAEEFVVRAESMIAQYPELLMLTWIDERRRIKAAYAAPSISNASQSSKAW